MCGIAGFIDHTLPEAEARERLGGMLARIVHRGPDGEGSHWLPPGVAVGMRRLSIIDLAGGAQPVWNESHTIGVVFNGEIYNHVELARELTARGHQFRTHCDTEVLVHLYEEEGDAMVHRLRGMFAFAIIDTRQRTLLIARDHFGQKPLYYTSDGRRFAFASELKCLLALPWADRTRDPAAFLDYVGWLSLPPPRTHFRRIHKLAAGHRMRIRWDSPEEVQVERFWRCDLLATPDLDTSEAAVPVLDDALRQSLRVHLRADVPVGVLLSSGLDSRTIAAYAQDEQGGGMQTFTCGFGGEGSELPEAARTAREIGSRHHELELGPDDLMHNLDRVAWHLDEPVGDPAAFAVLRICEMARQHVKVLLSGEGADELFGGYDTRYLGMRSTLDRSDTLRRLAPLLPRGDVATPSSRWQRLLTRAGHSRASEAVSLRLEGFPGDVRTPRGLTPAQMRDLRTRMTAHAVALCSPQRDTLSELLALDVAWQLPESLLQKADKMSMAASIELRTPLLDREIAAVAARIPTSLKLPPGGPGKLILRQTLARKLHEPLSRPKRGFPVPLAPWFRGPLRGVVEDALFSPAASWREALEPALVRTAWDDFQLGAWDGARVFYALWLHDAWSRRIGGASA